MPELSDLVPLCIAALFAGWIDAVSGGGGLVQLPALLVVLPTASPVQILATNKLSSVCGTTASATTMARRVRPDLRTALPMAGVAFVGAVLGALCASLMPEDVFRPLWPPRPHGLRARRGPLSRYPVKQSGCGRRCRGPIHETTP